MTLHEERAAPSTIRDDPNQPPSARKEKHRNCDGIERVPESKPLRYTPLKRGTNRAFLSDWPRRASADPDQWRAWGDEFPGCNFGVVTGDGVGVLDIDTKNAPEDDPGVGGFGSLITVEELLGIDLSNLPLVQTASGAHLYFRYEGHLASKVPWVPYLDVKADGGHQVAAPGTIREYGNVERVYTLLRGDLRDIPFAPEQLLQAIRQWRTPRTGIRGGSPSPGADLMPTDEAIQSGLPLNSRNDFMHRLACRWWSAHGLSGEAAVWDRAKRVWEATPNHDSFPWSEAEKAVRSARKHIAAEADKNLAAITAIMKNWGRS